MATAQFPDQLDVTTVLRHELACTTVEGMLPAGRRRREAPSTHPESHARSYQQAQRLAACGWDGAAGDGAVWEILRASETYASFPASVRTATCGLFAGRLCRAAVARPDHRGLLASVHQTWILLHALNPHAVSAATVNAWRSDAEQAKPKLAPQDIWLDPLVIFRCDTRVFQSADLADILLTVLSESLTLSRTTMRRAFALRQKDSGALKRPHLNAIIQLQESAAVQLLIEAAAFAQKPDVQWLIFEFIHGRFLEQRAIQKLVHFQAYDVAAIDSMVKHVPSMHACSEFLPELLMQTTPSLQLFAVRLATAVIGKYPIAANEGMAREVLLPHVQTTLAQIAGTSAPDEAAVGDAMLEAVAAVGAAFPPIRPACVQLAETVMGVAVDQARAMPQSAAEQKSTQIRQRLARWVAFCETLVDQSRAPGAAQPARLDMVDVEKAMGKLEAHLKADSKPGAPPAAEGAPPPPPPKPQPQPQGAHVSAKRLHSMMDVDSEPHAQQQPQQQPLQQQQQQQQQQHGNGDGASMPEQQEPAPPAEAAAAHNGVEPADAAGGGPASSLKKRHRHRNRAAGGPGKPASMAPKRSKTPGAERPPRAKDA
ncbi:Integrator complex subunit 2 [Coemansia nantahalensis]|uniref:Integrator complex subunit 2 n=1 Tax=Coemansia nantahalensis TaxID=2789366 RepID=A0ACC1JRF9_9FUNG|nr:Integrator complex subunit 2 [Coemansia nantahalensis]